MRWQYHIFESHPVIFRGQRLLSLFPSEDLTGSGAIVIPALPAVNIYDVI